MNVLSLFDGISCGLVALKRCGIKVDDETIRLHTEKLNSNILSSIESKKEKITKEQEEIDKLSKKIKDIL